MDGIRIQIEPKTSTDRPKRNHGPSTTQARRMNLEAIQLTKALPEGSLDFRHLLYRKSDNLYYTTMVSLRS